MSNPWIKPIEVSTYKITEKVTGVISIITFMSLDGIEHTQQVGKILGTLCVSHLIAILEHIAFVRLVLS